MIRKFFAWTILIVFLANLVMADTSTIRGEIRIDWINDHKFEIEENDPDINIEIVNRSNSEEVDNVIDVNDVNGSDYNDWDRIIRIEFDAEQTFSCSQDQIENITMTVDRMVNHCENYQTWINGTVQFADRYAEWMAEAARLKEEVRGIREDLSSTSGDYNKTSIQLTACMTDKQSYYDDWRGCDDDYALCITDLSKAKDSFAGKYVIGAVIGGIAVFLFTRKEKEVAQEAEEFEEVEY